MTETLCQGDISTACAKPNNTSNSVRGDTKDQWKVSESSELQAEGGYHFQT